MILRGALVMRGSGVGIRGGQGYRVLHSQRVHREGDNSEIND